jgi:hypothetical protein
VGSSGRLLQALSGTVPGQGDRVHELGESKEISLLAEVSEAVCLLEVEAVSRFRLRDQGLATVEFVVSVGHHLHDAQAAHAAGDVVEQLATGRVRPVDVLDDEKKPGRRAGMRAGRRIDSNKRILAWVGSPGGSRGVRPRAGERAVPAHGGLPPAPRQWRRGPPSQGSCREPPTGGDTEGPDRPRCNRPT